MSAYMISVAMEPTGALNIRTVSACPASACMTAFSASTAMVAAASAPRAPAETLCGKNRVRILAFAVWLPRIVRQTHVSSLALSIACRLVPLDLVTRALWKKTESTMGDTAL